MWRMIPEAHGPLVREIVGLAWRTHPLLWQNQQNIWNSKKLENTGQCKKLIEKVTHWWRSGQLVTGGGPEQRLVLLTEAIRLITSLLPLLPLLIIFWYVRSFICRQMKGPAKVNGFLKLGISWTDQRNQGWMNFHQKAETRWMGSRNVWTSFFYLVQGVWEGL